MTINIIDIAYSLPPQTLSNEDLDRQHPSWNMKQVERQVVERRIASSNTTALDLAVAACGELFRRHSNAKAAIDGITFCTQTPDYVMPPNSCLLHKSLALSDDVMAFDINHACSGFVYSLGIAQGLAASGAASNILIVNSDTYSKYISIKDRTTRVLFGDAAAVTWVATAPGQPGSLLDVAFATSGEGYDSFIVPAGGCRNPRSAQTAVMSSDANGNERSLESIHMDGLSILNFAKTKVVDQIRFLCEKNHLTLDSVDLFVPHQASKMALASARPEICN